MLDETTDKIAQLRHLWSTLLIEGPLDLDTDFFASGGDSLLASRMLASAEKVVGVRVSLREFYRQPTLGALVRAMRDAPAKRRYQFNRVTRLGNGDRKPVFVVIHSNGAFIPLGQNVGARHPFLALQLADRRSGTRLAGSVADIASSYVRLLRREEPTGPYILLGWCLAGNLAFEAACQLQAAGEEVAAVVLVDTWNPHYLSGMSWLRRSLAERSYGWQIILTDMKNVLRGRQRMLAFWRKRNIVRRFLKEPSIDAARPQAAADYEADQAFDDDLLDQLKQATTSFQPRPFNGRVLLVRSSEEPRGFGLDRQFGWGSKLGKNLRIVTISGDHLSIFMDPGIALLTDHVVALTYPDAMAAGLDPTP